MLADVRAKFISDFIEKNCMVLLRDKGAEYSRGELDVNSNFKRVGEALGIDPVTTAYVYFMKHIDSITNYVKTRETPSGEPIEGRIADAVNYLFIIAALLEEERGDAVSNG